MRFLVARVFLAGCLAGCLVGSAATPAAAPAGLAAEPALAQLLDFERGAVDGRPAGWSGGPAATLHADSLIVHGGSWSARLERGADAAQTFSALTCAVPQQRSGAVITLRGYLKTEGVTGYAGLWLRLQGEGRNVGFDNMQDRNLKGTHDWAEHTIVLPYSPETRQVVFGALLEGQGKVWVDDLRLLVDGRPYDQAPALVREPTVLDTDTEFTAGSNVARVGPLRDEQVANLVVLGKVWGFLKYHHPAVCAGRHHWDFELFRVLPRVLEAADRRETVGALLGWLGRLGEVPPCDPCARLEGDLALSPRLDWLDDEQLLGRNLGRRLREIHQRRPAAGQGQFYLGQLSGGPGNPQFNHEPGYGALTHLDAGYRLLALFRYWNIMEYWNPNRELMKGDWDQVLAEYIPRVLAAESDDDYRLVMLQLIAEVRDGHANLHAADQLRPPAGEDRAPVAVRFVEGQALVTHCFEAASADGSGLRVGDVILAVDGEKVDDLVRRWEPWYPASNQPHRLLGMARNLTRGPPGPVTFTVDRDGAELTVAAWRLPPTGQEFKAGLTHDLPGETFRLLGPDVAYLKLSSVEVARTADYLNRAAGTRGLIVDIRNYPAAFMVFALGGRLVSETTPFVSFTSCDPANPGAFVWGPSLALSPIAPAYPGQVVVLVDETSISQAEYTALALGAAPRAVVMGSTTAGADGNVSAIVLPGELATHISGIGVFHPDRRPTQGVGIVPDVVVTPTVAGLRQGRDEVLEAALRLILGPNPTDEEIRALSR